MLYLEPLYLEPLNDLTNSSSKLLHDHGLMEESITRSIKDYKGKAHRALKISEKNLKKQVNKINKLTKK
jgi:hypothetical protein